MTIALREQITRCINDGGPIGIVCNYTLFKLLTNDFEKYKNLFVWINHAKPDKIMAMNFKHIIYEDKPKRDRCLFICWKRIMRLNGRIYVPSWTNIEAYQVGLSSRMENY